MPRKGHCSDNAMMKNAFGILTSGRGYGEGCESVEPLISESIGTTAMTG